MKLFRLPVVRSLSHKWYIYYLIFTFAAQFITVTVWFVIGNFAIFRSVNQNGCDVIVEGDEKASEKLAFNPVPLQIIMSLVLIFHWFIVFFVIEMFIFTLLLWSLWSGIVRAANKMQRKFSIRNFIECVLEAIGEGEL